MNNLLKTAGLVIIMFISEIPVLAGDSLSLLPYTYNNQDKPALSLPYIENFSCFDEMSALFKLGGKTDKFYADGWIGINKKHLLVKVIVNDVKHIAPRKTAIWDGDGLELCIDAYGDGVGEADKETAGFQGDDDAKFMVALTPQGVVGLCTGSSSDNKIKAHSKWFSVVRDEVSQKTTYALTIPWQSLKTQAGLYPNIGIALQVNNKNESSQTKTLLSWGGGVYGPFRSGLFNLVKIPDIEKQHCVIGTGNKLIWNNDTPVVFPLIICSKEDVELVVKLGKKEDRFVIQGNADNRRYKVAMRPEFSEPEITYQVTIRNNNGILARSNGLLTSALITYQYLLKRLDECVNVADNSLLSRNFKSVKALVKSEWARLELYYRLNPAEALKTHQYNKIILDGLKNNSALCKQYMNNKRNFIFSYVSPHDRSIQYYQFSLPKNWDINKEYPLFFELHGAGESHPLSGVAAQVGMLKSERYGYSSPRTYFASSGIGYYCQPFARGNLGYKGISEIDVWETYNDLHKNFKIDSNRKYLLGFSMGGTGTWSIGTRTPDRWAAIAIMAGSLWGGPAGHDLGMNLSAVPIYIWCGERDKFYKNIDIFKSELNKFPVNYLVKTSSQLGHDYAENIQKEVVKWLVKHERKRPDKFSFVADTDKHLGIWGVTMKRDLSMTGLPRFSCEVNNNVVSIKSKGTSAIQVKPGLEGLGLSGNIKVVWNDKEYYNGKAKDLYLNALN